MSRPRRIVPSRDLPRYPAWLLVPCSLAGLGVALTRLPWTQDHTGLILTSIILSGFMWWLLGSLVTGCYRSQQGNYDRRLAPLPYWIHVAILIVANALLGYGWLHYLLLVLR